MYLLKYACTYIWAPAVVRWGITLVWRRATVALGCWDDTGVRHRTSNTCCSVVPPYANRILNRPLSLLYRFNCILDWAIKRVVHRFVTLNFEHYWSSTVSIYDLMYWTQHMVLQFITFQTGSSSTTASFWKRTCIVSHRKKKKKCFDCMTSFVPTCKISRWRHQECHSAPNRLHNSLYIDGVHRHSS